MLPSRVTCEGGHDTQGLGSPTRRRTVVFGSLRKRLVCRDQSERSACHTSSHASTSHTKRHAARDDAISHVDPVCTVRETASGIYSFSNSFSNPDTNSLSNRVSNPDTNSFSNRVSNPDTHAHRPR
jgi:hypothetical protein